MARDSSQRGERQGTNQRPARNVGSRNAVGSEVTGTGGGARSNATSAPDRERQINTGREAVEPRRAISTPERSYGLVNFGDPASLMQRMAEDLDRLFEQFGFGQGLGSQRALSPARGGGLSGLLRRAQGVWSPEVRSEERRVGKGA